MPLPTVLIPCQALLPLDGSAGIPIKSSTLELGASVTRLVSAPCNAVSGVPDANAPQRPPSTLARARPMLTPRCHPRRRQAPSQTKRRSPRWKRLTSTRAMSNNVVCASLVAVLFCGILYTTHELNVARKNASRLEEKLALSNAYGSKRRLGEKQGTTNAKGCKSEPSVRLPWSSDQQRKALVAMGTIPPRDQLQPYGTVSKALCSPDYPAAAPSYNTANQTCLAAAGKHAIDPRTTSRESQQSVLVNGKVLSVDDIVYGYEILFQRRSMHSVITFMGVGMQQCPNDAIVISDLLWRVRPRLVIELGTSGGGSALFYSRVMQGYDPEAKVVTIDPATPGQIDGIPLKNWNAFEMNRFCPHCTAAKDSPLWDKSVTFLRMIPASDAAVEIVSKVAQEVKSQGFPILVIEDSDHRYEHVRDNIATYAKFVTPGSYVVAQDTRYARGHGEGAARAVTEFLKAGRHGQKFVRDRRPEYLLFTQHSAGYLRRLEKNEKPDPYWDERPV